jgi:L-seryl-tRNA(Ser) seleniumtransferase
MAQAVERRRPASTDGPEISEAPAGLRTLPQLGKLLETAEAKALSAEYPRAAVADALRRRLALARQRIVRDPGERLGVSELFAAVREDLADAQRSALRQVINATGVVLHTNLGRAPLAPSAVRAVTRASAGYTNLEIDLATGERGSRYASVLTLLQDLTGAEAAVVVNNNAAAVLLALSALAAGGEVVVSRGELVEIGGSFRIPEIIAQSGARLIEVGTTNKTRAADYERAIGPATRALLKVHQSNYRIVGFTAAVEAGELAAIARAHALPMVEDLGSGTLVDLRDFGLAPEPTVRDAVASGADLVTFSGDKLLGGPQAGVIVGRRALIAGIERHPLLRVVRVDKLAMAALEATLRLHLDPARITEHVPVLRMLAEPLDAVAARAAALLAEIAEIDGLECCLVDSDAVAGGGALPEQRIASKAVALRAAFGGIDRFAARLRAHRPAVLGRIAQGRLLLDLRTIAADEVGSIAAAIRAALA